MSEEENIEDAILLPIKQRWYLLIIGISVYTGLALFGLVNTVHMQTLLSRFLDGDNGAARELMAMQQEGVTPLTIFMGALIVKCVVFVCLWIYRASENLNDSGVNYLTYQPGWSVGWFFIPIANIFMPVIVLKEMVKGTLSISKKEEYSTWQNNKLPISFQVWGIAFVIKMLMTYGIMFYGFSLMRDMVNQDPEAQIKLIKVSIYAGYIGTLVLVIEAIALFLLSKQITQIQESHSNQN